MKLTQFLKECEQLIDTYGPDAEVMIVDRENNAYDFSITEGNGEDFPKSWNMPPVFISLSAD